MIVAIPAASLLVHVLQSVNMTAMCVRTTCPTDGFMMAEQLSPQQWYAVEKGCRDLAALADLSVWLCYATSSSAAPCGDPSIDHVFFIVRMNVCQVDVGERRCKPLAAVCLFRRGFAHNLAPLPLAPAWKRSHPILRRRSQTHPARSWSKRYLVFSGNERCTFLQI